MASSNYHKNRKREDLEAIILIIVFGFFIWCFLFMVRG